MRWMTCERMTAWSFLVFGPKSQRTCSPYVEGYFWLRLWGKHWHAENKKKGCFASVSDAVVGCASCLGAHSGWLTGLDIRCWLQTRGSLLETGLSPPPAPSLRPEWFFMRRSEPSALIDPYGTCKGLCQEVTLGREIWRRLKSWQPFVHIKTHFWVWIWW